MKKTYMSPKAIRIAMTYEIICAKRCHFATYDECTPSETKFK